MTTSTATRVADGVTTAYLRDLTRRPAPTAGADARRAASRRHANALSARHGLARRPAAGRVTPHHEHARRREPRRSEMTAPGLGHRAATP
jgi:hypothetical protein